LGENSFYDAALKALNLGRSNDAVSICQSALRQNENDTKCAQLLGHILLKAGYFAAAITPLLTAFRIIPLNDTLNLNIAQAMNASGQGDARLFILRSLLANPQNTSGQVQLAELSGTKGNTATSVIAARRANIIEPDVAGHRYLLARCLGLLGNAHSVLPEIRRAYLLHPEHPSIIQYLGNVSAWQGLANDAERLFHRWCTVAPFDANAWHRFGEFLKERRRHKLAVRCLSSALLLDPQKTEAWRALCLTQWLLNDAHASSLAAAAWVSRDPGNMDAWRSRLSALDALEDSAGSVHCLTMLEPMASRAPAFRLELALRCALEGDQAGVESHLKMFFSQTHEQLYNGSTDLLRDAGFVGFLTFHLLRGRIDQVEQYIDRSENLELASEAVGSELFIIRHVTSAIRQYNNNPIVWESDKRLLVSVLVWGEEFADIWIKYGLSSILSHENKKFWDSRETVFQFVTTPETLDYLRCQPKFVKLEQNYRLSFIDITPMLTSGVSQVNYRAMLIAEWVPMCIGATEDADCITLSADYFFSQSAFSYIGRRLEEGEADVFFSLDYPISSSAVSEIEKWRVSDGTLEIPEHALGQFFLENMSSRVDPYFVDPADSTVPSDPSRIYSRLEHGILMRSLQPQLIYASSSLLKRLWGLRLAATDNGFADAALAVLGGFERMEMLVQPDLFGCAVIEDREKDRMASGQIPSRVPVVESVSIDLLNLMRGSGLLSPARAWSFKQPMAILKDESGSENVVTLVDQIAERLPHEMKYNIEKMMVDYADQCFERL